MYQRRGGCSEDTVPPREREDGDEEMDREEERKEESSALSNSPAKINPLREKKKHPVK